MIVGFIGARGSGKSASMAIEAYKYYCDGFRILSNIGLKFEYEPYTSKMIETFASEKNPLDHAVLLIDEAHILLDSRTSVTKRNRLISYFILQSRKRDVHIFYTTQSYHQIEKRLRDQTDVIISCEFDNKRELIRQTAFHVDKNLDRRRIVPATWAYDLYDTNEIVDPFGDDE